MASHAPQTILFVTNEGLVMNNGFSTKLAKGQFGIVDKGAAPSALGMAVVNSFPTSPKDRLFELKLGIAPLAPTRSQSNKAYSSLPFKLSEVVAIKVNAPKIGSSVDELLIGYDGLNPETAITLVAGDNEVIDITLKGEAIGMLGYQNATVTVKLYLEAPNSGPFTNEEIIEKGIERLKNIKLVGGVPITNYLDITPVNSTNPATVLGRAQVFQSISVLDAGNFSSLGALQAAYPSYVVKREGYTSGTGVSKYAVITPSSVVLPAFDVVTSFQAGDDCGEPDCTTITTTYNWTVGETCTAVGNEYTIQLKDDDCGAGNLAILQAAYPELVITVASSTANWRRTATLSGSAGAAALVLNGVTYSTSFDTTLAGTAAAFVATHSAPILTVTGLTVTALGPVITFSGPAVSFPVITSVAGGLVETLSPVSSVGTVSDSVGACQTKFKTVVYSDVVCEECSPVFRDLFLSEAPASFKFSSWVKASSTYDPAALMGIRLQGRTSILAGSEEYRDDIPFVYSSVKLSVANQAPGQVNQSFRSGSNGRFAVKLLSIASRPEAIGGDFYDLEERTRVYYENRQRLHGNNYGKFILGQETNLKATVQYVDYSIRIRTTRFAQGFSGELVENIDYHILVDACKHLQVEALVNALATAAGLPTVLAY